MNLSAIICFLTVATGYSMLPPLGKVQTELIFVGTDIADQRRVKRALFYTTGAVSWGIRVVKKLLKDAKPKPSGGMYRDFLKNGGWNQAVKDFTFATRNLNMKTSKNPKNDGLIRVSGQAGDRHIVLKSHGDSGKPEIEIMKFKDDRKGGRVFSGERIDRITYDD